MKGKHKPKARPRGRGENKPKPMPSGLAKSPKMKRPYAKRALRGMK